MSQIVLFTGFPGFLGRELLPRILLRAPGLNAVCVVQDKFFSLARQARQQIESQHPALRGRIELARGDITRPGLGLHEGESLRSEVTAIYHLAAIYDLSVPRAFAELVNVEGTRHVLDFAAGCPALSRLHYVSTCYVSGRYTGIFSEQDLDKGQTFNNFYEQTKFQAELLVRQRMDHGLKATVYRPAIVVGDSKTGATSKLDGPYYLLKLLLRQPKVALLPIIDDPTRFRFNVVPSDFVLAAIEQLSALPESEGKTYQLSDHAPPTCAEALQIMAAASGRKVIRVPLSGRFAKASIQHLPLTARVLQLPATLIDYMSHPTHYLNRDTLTALAPFGLSAPSFESYAPQLARFVKNNMALGSAALA